jgi:pSer/pThr/pTyr-binding forkhead associated (FHA) protein
MSQSKESGSTNLESADEILAAIAARKPPRRAGTNGQHATAGARPVGAAQIERPIQRPPMALLYILDDGKQEGERIRLRADRTVIGRIDGDVRIAHDVQMSSRHAEIVRERTGHRWRWLLNDIGSTNGTFVRIGSSVLHDGNELLIGQGRYRFEAVMPHPEDLPAPETSGGTLLPQPGLMRSLVPALVEISSAESVQRFALTLPEYWFGRDAARCGIVRADDPFVDDQHARFFRDKDGHWHVSNNTSINGLWLRVKSISLRRACQFRLGEQRFLFRVCE